MDPNCLRQVSHHPGGVVWIDSQSWVTRQRGVGFRQSVRGGNRTARFDQFVGRAEFRTLRKAGLDQN